MGIVQSHAFESRRMHSPHIGYLRDYYRKINVAYLSKTSMGHEHLLGHNSEMFPEEILLVQSYSDNKSASSGE